MGARTYRDGYGVPHVRADSVLELAREQGRVTARDRSWQLDYQRRRAVGAAAEVLGAPQVAWDTLVRRVQVVATARRALVALSEEARAFVTAYVEGVNAGLRVDVPELQQLGVEPGEWEPWTPLAVFHAQHVLFASFPGKLWHAGARSVLGEDEALLSRDPAYSSGSNAWAVGGARTASGLPLIGGDPHRVIESPGVYMQVRLACEDPHDRFDVLGFTFPGVPGVQHFAHAGEVAWAITNAAADYQDLFALPVGAVTSQWQETMVVRGADPVVVDVMDTERGPVLQAEPGSGGAQVLALADSATVLGDVGFEALLPLLRARSVADVDRALDHWVEPANNVVIADRSGRVRFRYVGRIPLRPEPNRHGVVDGTDPATAWTGWANLPAYDVSADGQVVSANERRGAESDVIGTEFAPPSRAERIQALLEGRTGLAPADFEVIHSDVLVRSAAALQEYVAQLDPGPAGVAVRRVIGAWDGRADADSTGMAAFAAWRTALTRRICAEPVFAQLADTSPYGPVFAPYLDVATHVGLTLERLAEAGTPFGIDVRRHAAAALDDAAGHPVTWGKTHVLLVAHGFDLADPELVPPALPRTPVGGDFDTVRCTGSLPAVLDECYRGSVARYVWDLADRDRSGWVVVLGASGDPGSPHHHDQLDAWAEVRLLPVVTDWEALTAEDMGTADTGR